MIDQLKYGCLGLAAATGMALCFPAGTASAQFGAVTTAETRPEGSAKVSQSVQQREGKAQHGDYVAYNWTTSAEYGLRNDVTLSGGIHMQSIDTAGLLVPGYVPGDEEYALQFYGLSIGGKFKFLNTAEHIVGLAAFWQGNYATLDKHSGKDKEIWSLESGLAIEKYLMEGQLTWRGNLSVKALHTTRGEIANTFNEDGSQRSADIVLNGQPRTVYFEGSGMCEDDESCFEWPNFPEMEIELKIATGLSYRFTNNWYVSAEALYEEEYETEVNRERHSFFIGPGLHYEGRHWAFSALYLRQLGGGGELIDPADDLHLIEKTENELRMKVSYNF